MFMNELTNFEKEEEMNFNEAINQQFFFPHPKNSQSTSKIHQNHTNDIISKTDILTENLDYFLGKDLISFLDFKNKSGKKLLTSTCFRSKSNEKIQFFKEEAETDDTEKSEKNDHMIERDLENLEFVNFDRYWETSENSERYCLLNQRKQNNNFNQVFTKQKFSNENSPQNYQNFYQNFNIKAKPYFPNKKSNDKSFIPTKIPLNSNKKKKKSDKKKKELNEREGDWHCYQCKNLNFKFRNKCNKCGCNKSDSDLKYIKAAEDFMKLADPSIYNIPKLN